MSAEEPSAVDDVGVAAGIEVDRPWALLALAVFWGWLAIRWVNDFLLPGTVAFPRDRPFVPVDPFASAADYLGSVAASLGPVGAPVDVVAGLVGFVAGSLPHLPALARGAWLTIVLTLGI